MPKFSFGGQTVHPPPKLAYKRHIFGMLTSPWNDFCCPRLHRLCCMRITRTHPNYCLLGQVFWACKTAAQKFGKFSLVYAVAHQFTSVLSRMVEIDAEWMSKRLHSFGDRKKHDTFWWCLVEPLGQFPPHFYVSAHCGPTLIFQVLSKSVQIWGSYNRKPLLWPSKVNAVLAIWAYNNMHAAISDIL